MRGAGATNLHLQPSQQRPEAGERRLRAEHRSEAIRREPVRRGEAEAVRSGRRRRKHWWRGRRAEQSRREAPVVPQRLRRLRRAGRRRHKRVRHVHLCSAQRLRQRRRSRLLRQLDAACRKPKLRARPERRRPLLAQVRYHRAQRPTRPHAVELQARVQAHLLHRRRRGGIARPQLEREPRPWRRPGARGRRRDCNDGRRRATRSGERNCGQRRASHQPRRRATRSRYSCASGVGAVRCLPAAPG